MNNIHLVRGKRIDTGDWVTGYLVADESFSNHTRHYIEFWVESGMPNVCNQRVRHEVDPATVEYVPAKVVDARKSTVPYYSVAHCPNCHKAIGYDERFRDMPSYCKDCGQRLSWE